MFVYRLYSNVTNNVMCFLSVDAIRNGIDILVGTPGRISDHLKNNKLDLCQLKHVVLDEVDQMLDMGFAEQVEEILSMSYIKGTLMALSRKSNCRWLHVAIKFSMNVNIMDLGRTFMCLMCLDPDAEEKPQTLLFSATCPSWVYDVAKKYMRSQYMHVDLIGKKTQKTATTVEVKHYSFTQFGTAMHKMPLLRVARMTCRSMSTVPNVVCYLCLEWRAVTVWRVFLWLAAPGYRLSLVSESVGHRRRH